MNDSFQQVQYQDDKGINVKTQEYGEPSIAHSRAYSKYSHNSNYGNPQQILAYFQQYSPMSQQFEIEKLHQSVNIKLKKYKQSVYYGEFMNGKRTGNGIMMYNNGRVYQGQWVNDYKHGKGYEKFPNQCIYAGNYVNGKPEGPGRYNWPNGQFYQGQWQNGLKHGSGMWRGAKGDSYIGEWKFGKADGYGVHTWVNGDRYQGQFKSCLKHGEGIEKFANGDIYKGLYEKGKPSGFGEYYWSNGSYFKGNFKQGFRNGNGIWKRNQGNSDKYEGQYRNDRKQGYGIFTWATGNVYKGNYFQDQRSGYGQMYWNDGSYYKGQWKAGIQHGQGEIYIPNDGRRKGRFQNNIMIHIDQEQIFSKRKNLNQISQRKMPRSTPNTYNSINPNRSKPPLPQTLKTSTNKQNPNKRRVIDLAKNSNQLPNRFLQKNNNIKNSSLQAKKSTSKQRILHSSFYLHKLHTRKSTNINDSVSIHRQANFSVDNNRRKSQIENQIETFTRGKINSYGKQYL